MECLHALEDIAGYCPSDNEAQPDGDLWPAAVARVTKRGAGRGLSGLSPCAGSRRCPGAPRALFAADTCSPCGNRPPHLSSGWTNGLSRPWDSGARGPPWNAGMFSPRLHARTRQEARVRGARAGGRIRESPRSPTHARGSAPSRRPALWMVAAITAPGSKPTPCLGAFR